MLFETNMSHSGITMIELKEVVEEYLQILPAEENRLIQLTSFLNNCDPSRLYDRTYALGHITASAFILSPGKREVLLIHHRELNVFLQPGGHIEACDASPLVGALREVTEETGITKLRRLPTNSHGLVPFDIDTHHILPSKAKNEPSHYHHDFRYLFVSESTTVKSTPEAVTWRWVDIITLTSLGIYERVVDKIRCILSTEA
jgi:8-oxo-dGTP pyrophosphatase MutT (NUDIX family)